MTRLLLPPAAFVVSLLLVGMLWGLGRLLAGPAQPTPEKTRPYTGGEVMPPLQGVLGYRPFFRIALFFAILHLGVLMVGSSPLTPLAAFYLLGLLLVLVALILG